MSSIRTYSELRALTTFEERYHYLALRGVVGESTFGFDRWMNQEFYRSREWKDMRRFIILRDENCDLGVLGHELNEPAYVHHMNPMTAAHISQGDPDILNPDHLITCSHQTHNAIHYGDASLLPRGPVERSPGDTKLW